jgi:hypothetical protein
VTTGGGVHDPSCLPGAPADTIHLQCRETEHPLKVSHRQFRPRKPTVRRGRKKQWSRDWNTKKDWNSACENFCKFASAHYCNFFENAGNFATLTECYGYTRWSNSSVQLWILLKHSHLTSLNQINKFYLPKVPSDSFHDFKIPSKFAFFVVVRTTHSQAYFANRHIWILN